MTKVAKLFEAIEAGDRPSLEALLAEDPKLAGARNEQGVSAVLWAFYHTRRDLAETVLTAGPQLSLADAAAVGRLDLVDEMTREDPGRTREYTGDGFHVFGLACFFGQLEAAALLLARGADANAPARNPTQVRPIHAAVAARRRDILALVLAAGAEVIAGQQQGFTALHAAARHGDGAMVRMLLAWGADRTAKTDDGKTPADMAQAHPEVLALLAD